MPRFDATALDSGIRDIVLLLRKAGFKTFTSCEGGNGHPFRHETVGMEFTGGYRVFHTNLVAFLRSQGLENFSVSLITDYPERKEYVYLEGIDLLSAEKRRRVIEAIGRKQRRLLRHPMLRNLIRGHETKKKLPLLTS